MLRDYTILGIITELLERIIPLRVYVAFYKAYVDNFWHGLWILTYI